VTGEPEWDVAILGGGSAGCVLAARLSEDPGLRVILIEAGRDLRANDMPREIASPYPGRAYFNPDWTWPALRVRMGSRQGSNQGVEERPYEQARILGGGSSINGIGANRGSPHDYEEWEAEGATGWGWRDVLPYFRKLERDAEFGSDAHLHGVDGPVPIRRLPREAQPCFARKVEEELLERGFAARDDQNGHWEDGVFPIAVNMDESGRRASFATAYLSEAVRRRPNLAIRTGTTVERLRIEAGRAVAAVLRREGGPSELRAGLFVVSMGALQSPALLLRSGIGPAHELGALGIPVAAARDGVGRNLQEHPSIGVSAFLHPSARLPPGEHYHIPTILRWSSGLDGEPPGDMHLAVNVRSGWHAVGLRIGTLFNWVNHSRSRGRVTLASPDPAVPPRVEFALLSDERDLLRLAQAFRLAAELLLSPGLAGVVQAAFPSTYSAKVKRLLRPTALNGLLTALAAPAMDRSVLVRDRVLSLAQEGASLGELLVDEAALHAHLRQHVGGVWHPSGTCRMGASDDRMAVCDPSGRIIGVSGLMVCDASVMPTIPCANLNIPVAMIAEKMADWLRRNLPVPR
jgi:5-(hydroxymethyl)furfural/furfural oxidase